MKKITDRSVKSETTLTQRVVKGGFWLVAIKIFQRVFSISRLIILARVLAPHDFGLMGIALLIMSFVETFTETGFQKALVQKKENVETYLSTAWTLLIIRCLILFAFLMFIAPYAAIFFKMPQAKPIIQAIGFVIILKGFTNIGVIYFQKEMEFNKQFIFQLSGTIVDFVVSVSAAVILKSVWALVFGLIASEFVRCLVSYYIHSYRPRFYLDLNKTKELFDFGKWIFSSSIIVFLVTQGDSMIVGKLIGASALGFYQMAYKISNITTTEITHVISQVTFPAYSKLQGDLLKLKEAYIKVLKLTAFSAFFLVGLLIVFAPDFTVLFLGEKWMPIVPSLQVLALAGLARSLAATTSPIFHAIGKPQIDTKLQMIRFLVLSVLIYPFTIRWGILGAAVAVFLSIFMSLIGFSFMVVKITNCEVKRLVKIIIFPLINVIIMTTFVVYLKSITDSIGFMVLTVFVVISILIYLGITYFLDRKFNYGMQLIVKESIKSFQGG